MQYRKLAQTLLLGGAGLCFPLLAIAAPGTPADEPLITASSVAPNMLFQIDTSGSMLNIVADDPFDASTTYFSCPTSRTIDSDLVIHIQIKRTSGIPYFDVASSEGAWLGGSATEYDWGTTSGNGPTAHAKRCFDPTATYQAALLGNRNNGSGENVPGNTSSSTTNTYYGNSSYSGNYLNWYFGYNAAAWGNGATRKPGTQTRMEVIQSITNDLLLQLKTLAIRVGLSTFNASNANNGNATGALIQVGINNITTNYTTMVAAVSALTPLGGTPLARTMLEIGRYFVQGFNAPLILHPGESDQTTKNAYTVFNNTPDYNSGVTQSSPMQYYCQKNFTLFLTDGEPSAGDTIDASTGLINYSGTNNTDSLPDIAMAMFQMDLRPDLQAADGTQVTNNVSTFTVGFGGGDVQLLTETAAQAGGQFFNATNTSQLYSIFQSITSQIFAQSATSSAVSFSSQNLAAGNSVFQATFNTLGWTGDLVKYPITSNTGTLGAAAWSEASLLDSVAASARVMITYNETTKLGVAFRTLGLLSVAQQLDLAMSPTGIPDLNGQLRLNFLRGDRTQEGILFRTRTHVLADIVDSSPVYVAAPESAWPDISPFPTGSSTKYSVFANGSAKTRTPVVYVGNNGGSMDGYNANTGAILLSYIPANLFTTTSGQGLHALTDPAYQHNFYVDLPATVQDAYTRGGNGAAVAWRTVLVGGERGGGRGYFALDITNPSNFSEGNASSIHLWQFSSSDNANLGYTFSQPVIGLMNNGKWAAIFGNGYNNTGTGSAQLFIVYLDGGLDGTWTSGTDYIVIDTKVGTLSNLNGLSSVAAIDTNGDHVIDRVYAGDVLGNMWAFDLSSTSATSWKVAYGTTSTPLPLFDGTTTQPITAGPLIIKHPTVVNTTSPSNSPNVLVLFGTGQFITTADKTTTSTQAFYGVWDNGTNNNLTVSSLMNQPMLVSSSTQRVMNNLSVPYTATSGQKFGWYITLPSSGERVVTSALIHAGVLFFNTMIPTTATACSSGGTGFIMAVDPSNGGQPSVVALDVNNDSQLTDTDKLNGAVVSGVLYSAGIPMQPSIRGDYLFVPGSGGTLSSYSIIKNDTLTGRISWEDLRMGR